MSPSEVNAALNGAARINVKNDGHYTYFKNYLKKRRAKGVLSSARAFYVRFFDRRVYQVELFYQPGYKSANIEPFVREYSISTNFAVENFKIKNGYAKAKCLGFIVEADTILTPHIQLTDIEGKKRVDESRK